MPWTGIAAAVAGSALSSAGGILSANSANAKSKRAALMQFAMQNYLMDKQNEYNKPINQMKRLEEAGLNPNLVYGSGADALSASPSGGAMPSVTPSKMQLDFFDKMSMIQQMKQQQAQIDRTKADTNAINENLEISRAKLAIEREIANATINRINATTKSIDADRSKKDFWSSFYSDPVGTVADTSERVGRSILQGAYDFGRNIVRSYRNERVHN